MTRKEVNRKSVRTAASTINSRCPRLPLLKCSQPASNKIVSSANHRKWLSTGNGSLLKASGQKHLKLRGKHLEYHAPLISHFYQKKKTIHFSSHPILFPTCSSSSSSTSDPALTTLPSIPTSPVNSPLLNPLPPIAQTRARHRSQAANGHAHGVVVGLPAVEHAHHGLEGHSVEVARRELLEQQRGLGRQRRAR